MLKEKGEYMNSRWNKLLVVLLFLPLFFVLSCSSSKKEQSEKDLIEKESEVFLGKWEGFITKGRRGIKMQFVLEILKNEDNTLQCLFGMPLQGIDGMPVQEFSIKGNTISVTIPLLMFTYSGSLKENQQTIEGVFKIGESETEMNLKKVVRFSSIVRPQTPKKPYPYNEQDVKFPNLQDDIILAGTLTYPKSGEPFPAAILISGAGPQDRNEEGYGGHRFFHVLADYLTKGGIAVLRYDDRGVGESTGSQDKITIAGITEDAKAAFQFLKTRSFINPQKIGLIGHSEGGLIAQIVASGIDEIGYIVLMAGPALPGRDIYLYQQKVFPGQSVFQSVSERILTVIEKEKNEDIAREKISSILKEIKIITPRMAEDMIELFLSPELRYLITIDPVTILSKVKCPVLALGGNKDVHIPSSQNLKAVEEILQKAGNKNYKTVEFPNINHLFQTANTGSTMEYSLIEETIAPVVLKTIGDWIIKQVK